MFTRMFATLGSVSLLVLLAATPAAAQVVGTFKWQTHPYCNVVTVTVVQQGGAYQLTGSDDLCGSGAAPTTGTAVVAAGGLALGFTTMLPSGHADHVTATISLGSGSGSWADSDGNSGSFILTTGPAPPSGARPVPPSSITVIDGPNSSTMAAQSTFGGSFAVTIVTPHAGHLSITKAFAGSLVCSIASSYSVFLLVDGVPLQGSAILVQAGVWYGGQISGATPGVLPAGSHVISVGGMCSTGNVTTSAFSPRTASSTVVLP